MVLEQVKSRQEKIRLTMNTFYMLTFLVILPTIVEGHGYMKVPPNRASRWRTLKQPPFEYTDNQLFCGGKAIQWTKHGGKCGVCGDEYGITVKDVPPLQFAYPGEFAINPPIVRHYTEGQLIPVTIHITANHRGSFTFRVAPLVNPPIKQEDLDKTVLKMANGDSQWVIEYSDGTGDLKNTLELPKGFTCKHCVLQWWYSAANDAVNDEPETFVNCADIGIRPVSAPGPAPGPAPAPGPPPAPVCPKPAPCPKPVVSPIPRACPKPVICPKPRPCPVPVVCPNPPPSLQLRCRAIAGGSAMDLWCKNNCARGFCPRTYCSSECKKLIPRN